MDTSKRLYGIVIENQNNLVGRSNEVISPVIRLYGYVINTNQGNLIGYTLDGIKLGAFDRSFN